MRNITLINNEKFKAAVVLKEVVKLPLGGGQRGGTQVDEMRRDMRLLDALEASDGDRLDLEDADWNRLCEKIKAFPFAISDRELLALLDAVLQAPAVANT